MLPAADPPHRAVPGATADQRFTMLSLAIGDEPGLLLDHRELDRAMRFPGRPSYTVDTLRELRGELGPSRPLAWLVGADSLLGLTRWHEWEALFGLAHFVVAERPGSPFRPRWMANLAAPWKGAGPTTSRPCSPVRPGASCACIIRCARNRPVLCVRRSPPAALAGVAAAGRGRLCGRPWPVPLPYAVNAAAPACPYNRPHVYRVDPL